MRFYRLEKENLWTYWGYAILKSFALALGIVVLLAIIMGYKFMIVSSGSMAPTLPVGSLVMVTPCEYDDLELGDIVTISPNFKSSYSHGVTIIILPTGSAGSIEPDDTIINLYPAIIIIAIVIISAKPIALIPALPNILK